MALSPKNPPVYVVNLTDLFSGSPGISTSQNQQTLLTAIGTPNDAAWNGTAPSATVIALLKAIAQNTGTT